MVDCTVCTGVFEVIKNAGAWLWKRLVNSDQPQGGNTATQDGNDNTIIQGAPGTGNTQGGRSNIMQEGTITNYMGPVIFKQDAAIPPALGVPKSTSGEHSFQSQDERVPSEGRQPTSIRSQTTSSDSTAGGNLTGAIPEAVVLIQARSLRISHYDSSRNWRLAPTNDERYPEAARQLNEHYMVIKAIIDLNRFERMTKYTAYLIYKIGTNAKVPIKDFVTGVEIKRSDDQRINDDTKLFDQRENRVNPEEVVDGHDRWEELNLGNFDYDYNPENHVVMAYAEEVVIGKQMTGLIVAGIEVRRS